MGLDEGKLAGARGGLDAQSAGTVHGRVPAGWASAELEQSVENGGDCDRLCVRVTFVGERVVFGRRDVRGDCVDRRGVTALGRGVAGDGAGRRIWEVGADSFVLPAGLPQRELDDVEDQHGENPGMGTDGITVGITSRPQRKGAINAIVVDFSPNPAGVSGDFARDGDGKVFEKHERQRKYEWITHFSRCVRRICRECVDGIWSVGRTFWRLVWSTGVDADGGSLSQHVGLIRLVLRPA